LRHWPPNPHALYGVFGHQVVEAVVTAKREEPPRNEALVMAERAELVLPDAEVVAGAFW